MSSLFPYDELPCCRKLVKHWPSFRGYAPLPHNRSLTSCVRDKFHRRVKFIYQGQDNEEKGEACVMFFNGRNTSHIHRRGFDPISLAFLSRRF